MVTFPSVEVMSATAEAMLHRVYFVPKPQKMGGINSQTTDGNLAVLS